MDLVYACRDVAPMGLTDRCRPMATKILLYMLERAADHYGSIRWLPPLNFLKVVLVDRLEPHTDHLQRIRLMHVKTICKMWLTGLTRVQRSAWPKEKTTNTAQTADTHGPAMACNGLRVDDDLHG